MKLVEAYKACEAVVKEHSSSFYRAFSILPEAKRNAVWAVYAFCRTVDDIVDEHPKAAESMLVFFEQSFTRFLEGNCNNHPHWIALADVFRRYPMDPAPFWDMIRGQRQDLVKYRYETVAELETYCYLVAGTVGLMLLPILTDHASSEMKDKAVKLGIAMQITNILRDVAEDYDRGRVYLPQDLMRRYRYQDSDIKLGTSAAGWSPLFRHLSDWAERSYQEGLSAHVLYPRDSRASLSAAGYIYREILVEAQRRCGDVFAARIRVSGMKKMSILFSLLSSPSTWKKQHRRLDAKEQISC